MDLGCQGPLHPAGPEILAGMAHSFFCVGGWTFQAGNGGEGIDTGARGRLARGQLLWDQGTRELVDQGTREAAFIQHGLASPAGPWVAVSRASPGRGTVPAGRHQEAVLSSLT